MAARFVTIEMVETYFGPEVRVQFYTDDGQDVYHAQEAADWQTIIGWMEDWHLDWLGCN
jgi:hypothetical protein